jgi:hypothetical protein
MRPDRAIAELTELKRQADNPEVRRHGPNHERWKSSVLAVMQHALPSTSSTPLAFSGVRYSIGIWSGAPGESEQDARYFAEQVSHAVGFIDAAIYELGLLTEERAVEPGSYDDELWQHVRHSVEEGRWEQVASQAAIFVEDKVRRWSGRPTGSSDRALVGKDLMGFAFNSGGPLALGSQANETEGWRMIAVGFASALSNVVRHNIEDRVDLKRYALGVLGTASLLLTQVKYEHPDALTAAAGQGA